MTDRPLTTGEGNTADDWREVAERAAFRALRYEGERDEAQQGVEYALSCLAEWQERATKAEAECGRLREREQAAHGEGYDQGVEDVWSAPVCSVCGADHDADESAMCEGGEVVSFREWVDAAGRLREQLDAARQALKKIADGTWNVGTGKNLTAREFARAALAAATPDTPPKDSGGAQQARAVREQEA